MIVRDALLSVIALLTATNASAACTPSQPVAAFLAKHPSWAIRDMSDLGADDRALWDQYHKGKCPGMAFVDLEGSGQISYALELINRPEDKEQLIVLKSVGGKLHETVLEPPFKSGGLVVWRAPPGKSGDMYTGKRVYVAHDSIIWERMEASSQQIYLDHGRFKRLQTSD
jgi:hypothetical protein